VSMSPQRSVGGALEHIRISALGHLRELPRGPLCARGLRFQRISSGKLAGGRPSGSPSGPLNLNRPESEMTARSNSTFGPLTE